MRARHLLEARPPTAGETLFGTGVGRIEAVDVSAHQAGEAVTLIFLDAQGNGISVEFSADKLQALFSGCIAAAEGIAKQRDANGLAPLASSYRRTQSPFRFAFSAAHGLAVGFQHVGVVVPVPPEALVSLGAQLIAAGGKVTDPAQDCPDALGATSEAPAQA